MQPRYAHCPEMGADEELTSWATESISSDATAATVTKIQTTPKPQATKP